MLQGHKNSVISVAPSPVQGGLFATGSGDMRARIWRFVLSEHYIVFRSTNHILGSRDMTPLVDDCLRPSDMSKGMLLRCLRTLFSIPLSLANSLIVLHWRPCLASV